MAPGETDKQKNLLYIFNLSQNKYLGTSSNGEVILEEFEKDKPQLLWIKGKSNPRGYFTLENCTQEKIPKTMTAMSSSILRIKGNYCDIFSIIMICKKLDE